MLVTFAGSIVFLYVLGRQLFDEETGLASAMVFAANRVVHYPAMMMRGDGWVILLLLAGACVFIRGWFRKFRWYHGLASGLLLGLSFATLAKSGFAILALAIAIAYDCQFRSGWRIVWTRSVSMAIFAVAAFAPVVFPFFLYGMEYFFWNYVIATHLKPSFAPWGLFRNIFLGTFAILPFGLLGLAVCLVDWIRHRRDGFAPLITLLLAFGCFIQVILNKRPFVQAFYIFVPFLCLLVGRGVSRIAQPFGVAPRAVGLSLFCLSGLAVNLSPAYWDQPDAMSRQIAYIRHMNQVIPPDETFVGEMGKHPVFRMDGTYYPWRISLKTMQAVDPDFEHDFVEELRKSRPFMITDIFARLDHDPSQIPRMKAFLEENYRQASDSKIWIRKNGGASR